MTPPENLYLKFWKLFNAEKFFEAHEILEILWRKIPEGQERDFYQGLIQIAAAFVHVQKGTPDGGRKLLKKASEKFQKAGILSDSVIQNLLKQTEAVLEDKISFPKVSSPQVLAPFCRNISRTK